ncbi:hypothetical protein A6A03_02015 [Chloroflexus islandicus]|uniref:Uncharacterized protein n=1 Tax=Chloroflexus islandicus TaxID=1707952 RepID=A0A178MBZ9_9CHLR|nr:hypothetical protein [Chloroflexus islandicus]OAN46056.1 hypothetical protein A6A03_02015 [Chloroflexus islandicus]
MRVRLVCLFLCLLIILAGCGRRVSVEVLTPVAPTPTIAPFFQERPTATLFVPPPTHTPLPTRPPATPTPVASTHNDVSNFQIVPVYRDSLSPGWSMDNSALLSSLALTQTQVVALGRAAIAVTPSESTGILFFTLTRTSGIELRRDRVAALRFRLSGGATPIANDAMTVSVVGSNRVPYWVPNDDSVSIEGRVTNSAEPLFPETRLYFLGLNRAIAPGEWAEIYVWLDDLIYEPQYTYVTGFYLKTSSDLVPQYYVDQIEFLVRAP